MLYIHIYIYTYIFIFLSSVINEIHTYIHILIFQDNNCFIKGVLYKFSFKPPWF